MPDIAPVEIPEEFVAFAKAAADLAAAHGIDRFEMKFRPKWNLGGAGPNIDGRGVDRRVSGDLCIVFEDVDNRGRPCRNLTINCQAALALHVVQTPPSY